ncbi:hypothetical protein Glove_117g210 [Diversispora epigaea]|uniref:BTB domain-containing protein n=1 Tax=Diversispora epigaea TaxID=1348612 RepID=A0A397J416_9GLOM|nr:hypothetical protein Glove_117g210 [Diversispora epigaea]
MALKFFEKLSQNFVELLNDNDNYDVIIEVKNKEKSFTAHSNILRYRSSYFRKELENIQSNENNIKTIIKSRISAQIFDVILKYIYGGIVNLESVKTKFIFKLMLVADDFELEELTTKIETFLIETKASWLRKHTPMIFLNISDRKRFDYLLSFCNDNIEKYPNLIFEDSDFNSLPESALVSLLKRDDLQMKEVEIWHYVIKWGIAQNPTLPTNLGEWSNENIITLKTTLQQCLPYIRYFHLSSDEVRDSIRPYKKILDKQLWKDIKQHLSSPKQQVKSIILPARFILSTRLLPHAKESFSTIISEGHAAEISTWIDFETTTYSTTNIPYKFELILRGSRDGFAPQTFWDVCHGHVHTVLVVKVKGTDEILGGYSPLAWDNRNINSQWIQTNESFIFSLKNGSIQNSILSRIKIPKKVITNIRKDEQKLYGPYFGDFCMRSFDSNDFTLDNDCYCADYGHYEKPIRKSSFYFSIDDYEVFKIIKKS